MDNELLDYEDDEVENAAGANGAEAPPKKDVKGSYVSIHSSGFRDFLLKPELLRAIVDCGFEHPSEGDRTGKVLGGGEVFWGLSLAALTAPLPPLLTHSAARVHPAGHPGHGRALPS